MKKKIGLLVLFLVHALLLMLAVNVPVQKAASKDQATSEKVIYIAGEEYGYPIEYYDHIEKEFKGAMPDLLERISEKTGIRFQYISFGEDEELIKNLQVDLVAYYNKTDQSMKDEMAANGLKSSSVCFTIQTEEEVQEYALAFTKALDEKLRNEINDAIAAISQESKEQILLFNIAEGQDDYISRYIQLILIILLVLFIIAAILFFILYRRNLKRCRQLNWRDDVTETGNMKLLAENFTNFINDENRSSYCLVSIGLEHLGRWEEENTLAAGKALLKSVAHIIGDNIGREDFYARVRGNQFIILMQYVSKLKLPQHLSKDVLDKIQEMLHRNENTQTLSVVAGLYFLGIKDTSLDEAIRSSVMAYQWARKNKKMLSVFDTIYEERVKIDRELEKDAETAVEKNEFIPYFHPNIQVKTSKIVNYEVLARWQHPTRGLLFPGQFIPIMKRKNLLTQMDMGLFETVCALLEDRMSTENEMIYISFNLTPESLRREQFAETLSNIAAKYHVLPKYIGIDISESITTQNKKEITEKILQLKQFGFSVTLDGFGGEYSSFVDLEAYDIDYVKLDRSLLKDLKNDKTRLVVKGMVDLCHNIGVKVIGEGIESKEQLVLLQEVNCDAAQGFYFCHPMPFSEIKKA